MNKFKLLVRSKLKNEDERGKNVICNIIILAFIALVLIFTVFVVYYSFNEGSNYRGDSPIFLFLILGIFSILYILSKKGYYKAPSVVLIAVLYFSNAQSSYKWGVDLPIVLLIRTLTVKITKLY